MRYRRKGSWFLLGWLAMATVSAQEPPTAPVDPELTAHLQSLQRRIDDASLDVAIRARTTMELASTLDRAAQTAATADIRRARWSEALTALDRFRDANPGQPLARPFEVQAGVYLWARARSWVTPARLSLANAAARAKAVADLKASLERLQPVVQAGGENDVFMQNARFRLAQTLADLAVVGPGDPQTHRARNEQALAALSQPFTEPSLQGFGLLLRASMLTRLGRLDDAWKELGAAIAANPAPPEADVLDVQIAVLTGRSLFDDARKTLDLSKLAEPVKLALKVRVDLEEYAARQPGPTREAAEAGLFRDLKALRSTPGADVAASLVAAAGVIREPGPGAEPEAWDLLADGALARGEPERAGSLDAKGADRASALGKDRQTFELRLKAAAALFQAGMLAEADPLLSRVVDDPRAGELRPRAGLLRAVSLGRALAQGNRGASTGAYASALQHQIKAFPDDPTASEARWLLGKLRLAESDRDAALALWEAIPHAAPRWLESRREIARLRQESLDVQRISNDGDAVARKIAEARAFLTDCLSKARSEDDVNELLLARARLELTPVIGRADEARNAVERVLRSAARPAQRDAAYGLQVIALAQSSRYVEAEQAARRMVSGDAIPSQPALLTMLRLLDRSAAEAESDLKTRRMGMLMSVLISPLAEHARALSPAEHAEVRLREIRARLFSGDDGGARAAIAAGGVASLPTNPALLRDLAETYARLEAYELASDVQRLRARQLPSGSLPWLDARYGLALACYRAGKTKEALSLIDATAILHPGLGGGELREKFIRLRQRIEPND